MNSQIVFKLDRLRKEKDEAYSHAVAAHSIPDVSERCRRQAYKKRMEAFKKAEQEYDHYTMWYRTEIINYLLKRLKEGNL